MGTRVRRATRAKTSKRVAHADSKRTNLRDATPRKAKDEADTDTHDVAARRLRRVLGESMACWREQVVDEELAKHENLIETPFMAYDTREMVGRLLPEFRSLRVEDLDGDWGEASGKGWAIEQATLADLLALLCDRRSHTWKSLIDGYDSMQSFRDGLDVFGEEAVVGPTKGTERLWVNAFIAGALAVAYEVLPRLILAGEAA